jgi:hypothetical protein
MKVRELTPDESEIQQRHKEPEPETVATTRKQRKFQRGPERDHSAGGRQARSRACSQDSKNECQNIVQDSAPTQTKGETTSGLGACAVGAPATPGYSLSVNRRNGEHR